MSNDLVGWWPLHEDSGEANDLSGEGNDGTVNGAVQGVAGRSGLTAYSFDGTDDYVDIPDNIGVFSGSEDFTIALWIRPKDLTTDYIRHIHFQGEGKVEIYNSATNGEVTYAVEQDGAGSSRATTASVSTNEWTHLVGTFSSGSSMELYKDGSLADFLSHSITSTTQNNVSSRIGSFDGTSYWFDGSIADARVYNRVLSQKEVQALYDQGTDDYTEPSLSDGTDTNAISRYKFEGDVTDSWGSNDGTDNTSAGYTQNAIDGQAKSFDGTDDYVDVPNFAFDKNTSFSICTWVNWSNAGNGNTIIGRYDGSAIILQLRDNGTDSYQFRVGDLNNDRIQITDGRVTNGVWDHVVGVYDSAGPTLELYQNGGEVASETSTVTDFAATEGPDIGRRSDGANYFGGEIDDVRIYDRALSPAEIQDLYQWGTRGRDLRKELVKV